ncbi:hypothetical protein [Botrimarina mediterranea]|uniref:Xylose isomerase-like TIM barrel n=1 Tax=Botrimarina mediterranea TaxID=2528022 RepID=A0A518KD50_9BACT|nr:hypothetical protein [Botrimarina mediterranea]QDV75708.1 hypothetical protein Spa11_39290 [Botrimarina mediterranea]
MERIFGFSTGALAFGDFARGIELQDRDGVSAIELSALRAHELAGAIAALPLLENARFKYRSFHAPSDFGGMSDREIVDRLRLVAEKGYPIILHPDAITDYQPWKELDELLLLENMDSRKRDFRTAREMLNCFKELPNARLCFDIGHARQIDPTMGVAIDLLARYRTRIAEVHLSEVDWTCHHVPISTSAALAFQRVASRIPAEIPVIIESVVKPEAIDAELVMAQRCLDPEDNLLSRPSVQTMAV